MTDEQKEALRPLNEILDLCWIDEKMLPSVSLFIREEKNKYKGKKKREKKERKKLIRLIVASHYYVLWHKEEYEGNYSDPQYVMIFRELRILTYKIKSLWNIYHTKIFQRELSPRDREKIGMIFGATEWKFFRKRAVVQFQMGLSRSGVDASTRASLFCHWAETIHSLGGSITETERLFKLALNYLNEADDLTAIEVNLRYGLWLISLSRINDDHQNGYIYIQKALRRAERCNFADKIEYIKRIIDTK